MIGYVERPYDPDLWSNVYRLLDPAVKRDGNSWDDVEKALNTDRAQLWVALDNKPTAALVTQVKDDELMIWLAGGRILSVLPFLDWIIEASKEAGTKFGTVRGRKGWERALRAYGWRREGDELVKRWNDG